MSGKTIGFVPTMGYLHHGHKSLVEASKSENDITIVSIFVNPSQFSVNEDLSVYPRDFERDRGMLEQAGVDIIFFPDSSDIYPDGFQTYIQVEKVSMFLEGSLRPTHFKGVCTVVAILLNLAGADRAYFGRKDAQQVAVISRMVRDLQIPTEIIACPLIREEDGLALSSRNVFLSGEEREAALTLYRSLQLAEKLIKNGKREIQDIQLEMEQLFIGQRLCVLQYIAFASSDTFEQLQFLTEGDEVYILIACKVGKTRLIDNFLITV